MAFPSTEHVRELRRVWADKFVIIRDPAAAEWQRFAQKVGKVMTINYSGRAVVDFGDGGWYDVAEFEKVLMMVVDAGNYDASANSAQMLPIRQS